MEGQLQLKPVPLEMVEVVYSLRRIQLLENFVHKERSADREMVERVCILIQQQYAEKVGVQQKKSVDQEMVEIMLLLILKFLAISIKYKDCSSRLAVKNLSIGFIPNGFVVR